MNHHDLVMMNVLLDPSISPPVFEDPPPAVITVPTEPPRCGVHRSTTRHLSRRLYITTIMRLPPVRRAEAIHLVNFACVAAAMFRVVPVLVLRTVYLGIFRHRAAFWLRAVSRAELNSSRWRLIARLKVHRPPVRAIC